MNHPARQKLHGLQNRARILHLANRVVRQRNADGISDAVGKQGADARRAFERADTPRSRLRNP